MSESINKKLENCLAQIYKVGNNIVLGEDEKGNEKTFGQEFLKSMDSANLSDELKYDKWCLETPEKSNDGKEDKDISEFKSLTFLSTQEFLAWSAEKKAYAFQKYGKTHSGIKKDDSKEDLITLGDYKKLIKDNPNWSPYLKAVAICLVPGAELEEINLDVLKEIGFDSWPASLQLWFFEDNFGHLANGFFKNLDFKTLFNHEIWNKVSDSAKAMIIEKLTLSKKELEGDIDDIKISLCEKLHFVNVNEVPETKNKVITHLKSLIDAGEVTLELVKKIDNFDNLSAEEKLLLLSYANDLEMSDIELIDGIENVNSENKSLSTAFLKIVANKNGGLTLTSLLKSKLTYSAKIEASDCLEFEDTQNEEGKVILSADQKKAAALKLVSYPYAIDLLFQKIQQTDKKLANKDLLLTESMLLETITAAKTLSKDLGLEPADIEKLDALSKEINENKSKPLEKRISTLRKIGRVLLNILEVPLSIFPLTFAKEARSWFFNPSGQIQYNNSKEQKEKLGGILSKINSEQPEKKDDKKEGKKDTDTPEKE